MLVAILAKEWLNPQVITEHHWLQRIYQVADSERASGNDYIGCFTFKPWERESSSQHSSLAGHLFFHILCPLIRFCFLFEFRDKTGNYRSLGVAEHIFQFKRKAYWLLPWMHIEHYSVYIRTLFFFNTLNNTQHHVIHKTKVDLVSFFFTVL